jgi:hypothetical protein
LGQMEHFKHAILDRLAQPAHPIERDYFVEEGHPERAQDNESWRIMGSWMTLQSEHADQALVQ